MSNTVADQAQTVRSGQASNFATFQNTVKPFIGAGILALPASFAQGGIIASPIVLVLVAVAAVYGIRLLLVTAGVLRGQVPEHLEDLDQRRSAKVIETYAEVAFEAFGKYGSRLTNFFLACSQVGAAIAYVSFIAHSLSDVTGGLGRVGWIVLLTPVLVAFSQVKSVTKVAPFSAVANGVYLLVIIIVFAHGSKQCCVSSDDIVLGSASGLAIVFGTATFAMEGIGLILPVEREALNKDAFVRIVSLAVGTVSLVYVFFGIFGYIFFGTRTESVITKNLGGSAAASAVKVLLSLILIVTYVLQLFPIMEMIDLAIRDAFHVAPINRDVAAGGASGSEKTTMNNGELELEDRSLLNDRIEAPGRFTVDDFSEDPRQDTQPESARAGGNQTADFSARSPIMTQPASDADFTAGSDSFNDDNRIKYRPIDPARLALLETRVLWITRLCRFGLVLFTALVAGVFSDFGLIVSLVGSLANSALCFSLPAVLYLKICKPRTGHSWQFSALPASLAVFGVVASIVGVYFSIDEMIHPPPSVG